MRPVRLALASVSLLAVVACTSNAPRHPPSPLPSSSATTAPPNHVQAARNLAVTARLRHKLWVAYTHARRPNGVHPYEIRGPLRGSVRVAYFPAARTYWAIADFTLTLRASDKTKVNSQEDTLEPWFSRRAGRPWHTDAGEDLGGPCNGTFFPIAVLRVWGIQCG